MILVNDIAKDFKFVKFPMQFGKVPLIFVWEIPKSARAVNLQILEGIGPDKPVRLSESFVIRVQFEIQFGKVPLREVP